MSNFIFVSCVIILLLKSSAVRVTGQTCKISNKLLIGGEEKQLLFYNCTELTTRSHGGKQKITTIPTDISPNVEALDLSVNSFNKMDENTFAKYVKIKYLMMNDTKIMNFASTSFKLLTTLEELNICALLTYGTKIDVLPSNIKKLWACKKKSIVNFVNAVNLKYVDVSDGFLHQFPNFNTKAPLEFVNFDGNLMNELVVEQLAPYCYIKELSTNLKHDSQLLTSSKYCNCSRLNVWIAQFNIKAEPFKCKPAEDVPCDKEFSEDILSKRRTCVGAKTRPIDTIESKPSSRIVIFVGAFLILLTIIMLAFAYRYVKSRKTIPADGTESVSDVSAESSTSEADENVVAEEEASE